MLEAGATGAEYFCRIEAGAVDRNNGGNHIALAGRARGGRDAEDKDIVDLRIFGDDFFDKAGIDEVAVMPNAVAFQVVEI